MSRFPFVYTDASKRLRSDAVLTFEIQIQNVVDRLTCPPCSKVHGFGMNPFGTIPVDSKAWEHAEYVA